MAQCSLSNNIKEEITVKVQLTCLYSIDIVYNIYFFTIIVLLLKVCSFNVRHLYARDFNPFNSFPHVSGDKELGPLSFQR